MCEPKVLVTLSRRTAVMGRSLASKPAALATSAKLPALRLARQRSFRLGELIISELLQEARFKYFGLQEDVTIANDLDFLGDLAATHVLIGGDDAFLRHFLTRREVAGPPLELGQEAGGLVKIKGKLFAAVFR